MEKTWKKRVKDSRTEQVQMVLNGDINGAGKLFGGKLMQWIDIVAAIVGKRHSEHNVVTAAIDNLQFKKGALLNDTVVLIGRLTYVGRSSMEVCVDTYVEDAQGMRFPINRAFLVMVAVDNEGNSVPVPGLEIETESQKADWEGGIKRMELRKIRRVEGY